MQITSISPQVRNANRVNVSVDGTYRFSLDIAQVIDLGIKVGNDYSEEQLHALESESEFGKLYGRALEYCLMRLHSAKEVRDYLYRKTQDRRNPKGVVVKGASPEMASRVFEVLSQKRYIDDEKFATYWVNNRQMTKGVSRRKLIAELRVKGVSQQIIEAALSNTDRIDENELEKVIDKKYDRYHGDRVKFTAYLARQGFSYDDIRAALDARERGS